MIIDHSHFPMCVFSENMLSKTPGVNRSNRIAIFSGYPGTGWYWYMYAICSDTPQNRWHKLATQYGWLYPDL